MKLKIQWLDDFIIKVESMKDSHVAYFLKTDEKFQLFDPSLYGGKPENYAKFLKEAWLAAEVFQMQ